MPRYKYSCTPCNLTDIKRIEYEYDAQAAKTLPMCPYCGMELARIFMRPPRAWMQQQAR